MTHNRDVRRFRPGDEEPLRRLFYDTVRRVNRRDYSADQVEAWAPDGMDPQRWADRIRTLDPFVCTVDGEVVGYGDLQDSGYIDHFFVDHRRQRLGIGTALLSRIEQEAGDRGVDRLFADVSKTARAFFEARGFRVEAPRRVSISGVELTNYRMTKRLSSG